MRPARASVELPVKAALQVPSTDLGGQGTEPLPAGMRPARASVERPYKAARQVPRSDLGGQGTKPLSAVTSLDGEEKRFPLGRRYATCGDKISAFLALFQTWEMISGAVTMI